MENSKLTNRKTSFNPEAVAFSPAMEYTPAIPPEPPTVTSQPARRSVAPTTGSSGSMASNPPSGSNPRHLVQPRFICPPFPGTGRPLPAPVAPLPGLGQTPKGYKPTPKPLPPGMTYQDMLAVFKRPSTRSGQGTNPIPSLVPQAQITPNRAIPDINELAADFGLPGLQRNEQQVALPRSIPDASVPAELQGERAGKLLQKALDKPLTAGTLARLLDGRELSNEGNQTRVYAQGAITPSPLVSSMQQPSAYESPAARLLKQHETYVQEQQVNNPIASTQSHDDRYASVQQPGRSTFAKRFDQGPEPSAADKYPDDAGYPGAQLGQIGYHYSSAQRGHARQQSSLHMDNSVIWPTPVEKWNVFADFKTPTVEDVHEPDNEVIELILGLFDRNIEEPISCDSDVSPAYGPLTPEQESGAWYGIQIGAIGTQSIWEAPAVEDGSWENPVTFGYRYHTQRGFGPRM